MVLTYFVSMRMTSTISLISTLEVVGICKSLLQLAPSCVNHVCFEVRPEVVDHHIHPSTTGAQPTLKGVQLS